MGGTGNQRLVPWAGKYPADPCRPQAGSVIEHLRALISPSVDGV